MSPNPLRQRIQQQAYRLVLWQLVGVLLLAFLAFLIRGKDSSLGVLAGGCAYGLPNLIFVWLVFRFVGAHEMTKFVTAFCLGELFKLILSGILFLVIVQTSSLSLLSVLVGFIGAIVSFWVVCFMTTT